MSEVSQYSEVGALRDGRPVEIRALRPEDRDDLIAAVRRIGTDSLYRRFFAVKREFSEKETSFFVNVDFVNHVALIAVVEEDGKPTIAGGGRFIVVSPGQAEVAFAVVDEYQGQGIGTTLMRHLVAIARRAGLRELIADVLPDNRQMLNVFQKSGLPVSTRRDVGKPAPHASADLAGLAGICGAKRQRIDLGQCDRPIGSYVFEANHPQAGVLVLEAPHRAPKLEAATSPVTASPLCENRWLPKKSKHGTVRFSDNAVRSPPQHRRDACLPRARSSLCMSRVARRAGHPPPPSR